MSWQQRYEAKLVSADEALAKVKSGDVVAVAPYTCTPHTLCNALIARGKRGELTHVRIDHLASPTAWTEPDLSGVFELHDSYTTPLNRAACHAGRMEYLPIGLWRDHELPAGVTSEPDVFLVPVSPPDQHGYCSFGPGVWLSRTLVTKARLV